MMIILLHAIMILCFLLSELSTLHMYMKNCMIENVYYMYLTRFGEPSLHHVTIFDIIEKLRNPFASRTVNVI